jgi:hypothetical protein
MRPAESTLPISLGELLGVEPLASAEAVHLPDPSRRVEHVTLVETFDRLRRCTPHSLLVLHAEASTGGWSLAAALHLAWERNASAVIVRRAISGSSGISLAQRLSMALLVVDDDPVDVALELAGQVSAPYAARALRLSRCAERLAEQHTIRGVLGVLNSELSTVPVALSVGDVVIAGRAAAVNHHADTQHVTVEVSGSKDHTWAVLCAAVPAQAPGLVRQVEAILRLARPPLIAVWARTRLDSTSQAAYEQAAFELLRRSADDAQVGEPPAGPTDPIPRELNEADAPLWSSELGWRIDGGNRAVWLTPRQATGEPSAELTYLIRTAWQRGPSSGPLIAQGDGWISWESGKDAEATARLRRAMSAFNTAALAHGIVLGVGRTHRGVSGLLRSMAEARLAAHLARQGDAGSIQWFDQASAPAVLAWLPVTDIAEVAELCLPDLMTARDRASLVDTVLALLDCGGSLSHASQRLGVHRNTVLSRVARARQLGLAFDDPAQRLALHVLCYALASLWSGRSVGPSSRADDLA